MKKLPRLEIYIILVSFFCLQITPILQAAQPRLEPQDFITYLAKAKEPLKLDELITASLRLSGVEDNKLDSLKTVFYTKINEVKAYFKGRGVSPELGDDLYNIFITGTLGVTM